RLVRDFQSVVRLRATYHRPKMAVMIEGSPDSSGSGKWHKVGGPATYGDSAG
ncbi:unnamed protein product, partial [Heterosigma akashiwo]